jgi:hypothetical protein
MSNEACRRLKIENGTAKEACCLLLLHNVLLPLL